MNFVRNRNVSDLCVPEGNQVLDRFIDPNSIIQDDIAYFFSYKTEVLKYKTGLFPLRLVYQSFIELCDHQYNTRNLHLDQSLNVRHGPIHLVISVEQKQVVTAGDNRRLDAFDDLGKERIRDVGHEQADDLTLAQSKALGMGIRMIIEFFDRALDLFPRRVGNVFCLVDNMRDSRR